MAKTRQPAGKDLPLPARESAAAARARLLAFHRAAGSLGLFYDLFPDSRPVEKDAPQPARKPERGRDGGGRGR